MENPFSEIFIRFDRLEAKIEALQLSGIEKDEIMSVIETARFLGLAKQTVYQLVSRNAIPVMKRAGRLYFSQKEIENWLRANRRISDVDAMEIIDRKITKK